MATTVYTTEDIKLQDDTQVTLKPLPIKPLRRFMKEWEKFGEVKDEDQGFDIFVACCAVALEKELKKKEKVENTFNDDNELTDEYKDYLEDVLDIDTIYKVLDVCGGLKLNDENLQRAAQAAAEEAGKI